MQPREKIDTVVHTDAHAESHHRQGRGFQPDLQVDHERVAEVADDGERQHDADRGAQGAEGEQAQGNHGAKHPQDDGELRRLHHLVGRGHHAGRAAGQQEARLGRGMCGAEGLHRIGDGAQGLGLVVGEKDHDRQHAAVGIEQAGGRVDGRDRLGQRLPVAGQNAPLERAFVPAGVDDFGHRGERDHGLHPGHGPHVPLELVHQRHHIMVHAAVGHRFHNHRDDVHADAELARDDPGVLIVAGILAEFRYPGEQVTNFDLLRFVPAPHSENDPDGDDEERGSRTHFRGKARPKAFGAGLARRHPFAVGRGQPQGGQDDRQEE